jgi:hypothetical protein
MSQSIPQICYLGHPGFHMLGEPLFRLSEGTRIASMVVQLDGHDAVLPLRAVAREFRVDPESADGKMLTLIEQALEFVVSLRFGDKLPSELYGGEASWEPTEADRRIAASRVRYSLVRCVFAPSSKSTSVSGGGAPGWEDEPKNRALLKQAITDAASLLDGSDEAEVTTRVASTCEEMAYIETMRRALGRGVNILREKLLHLPTDELPVSRREIINQVQTLARAGIKQIMGRFEEADARLEDVLALLRDLPAAIAGLHRQRDWLFRTNLAWSTVFADWEAAPKHFDEFVMKAVERTYIFLAPRFMTFQEWNATAVKLQATKIKAKVW